MPAAFTVTAPEPSSMFHLPENCATVPASPAPALPCAGAGCLSSPSSASMMPLAVSPTVFFFGAANEPAVIRARTAAVVVRMGNRFMSVGVVGRCEGCAAAREGGAARGQKMFCHLASPLLRIFRCNPPCKQTPRWQKQRPRAQSDLTAYPCVFFLPPAS